jgi:hypothetical protein
MFNFFKKKEPDLIPRYWVFAARPDPMASTGGFHNFDSACFTLKYARRRAKRLEQEERREWVQIVDTHNYQVWKDEW